MSQAAPAARAGGHHPDSVCPDCKITWHLDKVPYYWTRSKPCPNQQQGEKN